MKLKKNAIVIDKNKSKKTRSIELGRSRVPGPPEKGLYAL